MQRAIGSLASDAPAMALHAVKAGAARLGDEMESRAPELSGEFEGAIAKTMTMRQIGPTTVTVGPTHGMASFVEFGGELTPTVAEKLVFQGDQGDVFAERVVMPASPFIRPAFDEGRAAALEQVRRSAQRAIAQRGLRL